MIVLQRTPGGMAEFLTFHPDYNVGNGTGTCAWVSDPSLAFGFARKVDAEQFKHKYRFDHRVIIGEING